MSQGAEQELSEAVPVRAGLWGAGGSRVPHTQGSAPQNCSAFQLSPGENSQGSLFGKVEV